MLRCPVSARTPMSFLSVCTLLYGPSRRGEVGQLTLRTAQLNGWNGWKPTENWALSFKFGNTLGPRAPRAGPSCSAAS